MKYRNLFKEKTERELANLYKEFLDFEKTGVISNNTELRKIRDRYSVWFESNVLAIMERDLLHAISDIWFQNTKPYDNTKKYRYKIEFSGSDGATEGTIVLTEEQARFVDRILDDSNWDDYESDPYGAGGWIDIDHPKAICESDS